MIYAYIEKNAPNTAKFLKHLITELLNREPLKPGKNIIIPISEDSSYFPEFNEGIPNEEQKLSTEDFVQARANLAKARAKLLYYYIGDTLGDRIDVRKPLIQSRIPFTCHISIVIKDPKGIYEMAKTLGIETKNSNNPIDQIKESMAVFSENPSQINWHGKVIPIPPNSKQFCACRVAFSKAIGEPVHWDEIAVEIDGQPKEELKTNWHTVYNAVRLINQKIENRVGHKLFKSAKLSFVRIS